MVENYKDYIMEVSNRTGFITGTAEKVERLINILDWINKNGNINKLLALKGGTAINIAIFNFPRLSVDIDLDLNKDLNKEEVKQQREYITDILSKYLISIGYTINKEKSKNVYALDSFVAEYKDIRGNKDNIKIEINYMLRQHILETKTMKVITDVFTDKEVEINCVNPIEIYAAKMVALLNRTTARDLFDVYTLSRYELFSKEEKELLKNCFILNYIAICGYDLKDMKIENIEKISKQDIKNKLIPTLKNRNPKLCDVEDMKQATKAYLKDILDLNEKQKLFCEKFTKSIYEPELLFSDNGILDRIKNPPMIIWKLGYK